MGSWVMAVFVTVFSWILIFLLESRLACRIRIRLADDDADLEQAFSTVQSMLVSRGCRLQNSALYKGKQQLEFFLHIPAELDMRKLELCGRCSRIPIMLELRWISCDVLSQSVN
jgi:hypothetical protein